MTWVITHYPNHSPLFHSTNLQIEPFYILGYFYFVHLSLKFWLILFYILYLHKNSCKKISCKTDDNNMKFLFTKEKKRVFMVDDKT